MEISPDLFITPDKFDADALLKAWAWLFRKNYSLIGLSATGDMFLEADDGTIDLFDLVFGELKNIADSRKCFDEAT